MYGPQTVSRTMVRLLVSLEDCLCPLLLFLRPLTFIQTCENTRCQFSRLIDFIETFFFVDHLELLKLRNLYVRKFIYFNLQLKKFW